MTVLIVGGSGFLGTELVRQAASAGHRPAATFHFRRGDHDRAIWHHLVAEMLHNLRGDQLPD
ncbi:hypothetical protein ACFY7C_00320 [Streptomyces sp. NPDC012769]|uniref:hypothetical protein n=1 Tax=Streptomyces sp. NPDC012769 TaxID=3364848 RepID=UPI0036CCFA39